MYFLFAMVYVTTVLRDLDQISQNNPLQAFDIQVGLGLNRRVRRVVGIASGMRRACGNKERKLDLMFLDKASAPWLSLPAMWHTACSKL